MNVDFDEKIFLMKLVFDESGFGKSGFYRLALLRHRASTKREHLCHRTNFLNLCSERSWPDGQSSPAK